MSKKVLSSKRLAKPKAQTANQPKVTGGSGTILVRHLPKGFVEQKIRSFFRHFGDIEKVVVGRSKTTARELGHAYVKFSIYEVAEIAASSVNNYPLFDQVLQASVLPKKYKGIPRNAGQLIDADGKQTTIYAKWLKRQAALANKVVVSESSLKARLARKLAKVKRAANDLGEATDLKNMYTKTAELLEKEQQESKKEVEPAPAAVQNLSEKRRPKTTAEKEAAVAAATKYAKKMLPEVVKVESANEKVKKVRKEEKTTKGRGIKKRQNTGKGNLLVTSSTKRQRK
ncbi:MKI67 FHA domain-interacting nucleolar phosphoprotein [Anopheles bellator]|uniref:MKI67 FHA domain-interacting nucleolar phosphoprotein n=1 Tax=Anopheles bellator TaxID=139047 RepID=UPI0026474091|nr:MKI67 FHA domain-interacting nucleolar phosphoprotein [Anopheles bellator]